VAGREADHSTPSTARLRMRNNTSTSDMPLCREQGQLYLPFMQWGSGSHSLARGTWILTMTQLSR
jgi:hypothetical protein